MKLRAVKGMNDILPEESRRWQRLESAFRRMVELYGYQELRTPILEQLELFQKSTGETSEVVQKQMFTLERSREVLALRPEGTPSAARVYIGESMQAREPVTRWYYIGPMFRAEQPQRGRYRQFHQAGCELYGDAGPYCDAEMIDMLYRLLVSLGISGISVSINSLGGSEARATYREQLRAYFEPKKDSLSPHAQERLLDNPLRILDSKDPRDKEASEGAPALLDALTPDDRAHFDGLKAALDALGTPYTVDPRLVRGLDYYTRTCFELSATTGEIGSQNALLGGGRYDGMLGSLGGPDVPAIGFAMGMERILLALGETQLETPPFCFIAPIGAKAGLEGLKLARRLREQGVRAELDGRGNSLKSMLRRANTMGARFCLVFGDAELERGMVQLKDLSGHEQNDLETNEAIARIVQACTAPAGSTT
jgi:histidyl-tRNA synthetase